MGSYSGVTLVHGVAYHTDRTKRLYKNVVEHASAATIGMSAYGGLDIPSEGYYSHCNFIVPKDFVTFLHVYMVYIAQAATEAKFTFNADFVTADEVYSAVTETKTDVVLRTPAPNDLYIDDTTLVLANLAIDDILGVLGTNVTGDIAALGYIFEYTADQ